MDFDRFSFLVRGVHWGRAAALPPRRILFVIQSNLIQFNQILLTFNFRPYTIADFNLSGGCFGTDMNQNCAKLSNIGVHGLIFGPMFDKFHSVCFSIWKHVGKLQYGQTKLKNVVFRKKSWRSYTPHIKVGKNKCSDIIYSHLINLIIYNQI